VKRAVIFVLVSCFIGNFIAARSFSQCYSCVIPRTLAEIKKHPELSYKKDSKKEWITWHKKTKKPFTELILSWNSSRPMRGFFSFWVRVKHRKWLGWRKLIVWGKNTQKSFSNEQKRLLCHSKHVRVEMQKKRLGYEYEIKIVAHNEANIRRLKVLFVNATNWNNFREQRPRSMLPSTLIKNVPKKSQWWLPHKRAKDLCSPTSLGILASYLANKYRFSFFTSVNFNKNTARFAQRAYDSSLNIYGNWPLNVAQAYIETMGRILYRVERLNNFEALHRYLTKKIPVAVSIRGRLRPNTYSYDNGHFVVVVGWDRKTRRVICIDPFFRGKQDIVRRYRARDFIRAWGKSRNLSYVAAPYVKPAPPVPRKKFKGVPFSLGHPDSYTSYSP
jgi:hypothetical protein